MLWEFLYRVLGNGTSNSRFHAKERLRLVLVHDRANMSPFFMNRLKEDMISVISNYMVIDEEKTEVILNQDDAQVILKTIIPVKKIRRDYLDRIQPSNTKEMLM